MTTPVNVVDLGTSYNQQVTFKNKAKVPTDPTNASLTIEAPDGTQTAHPQGDLTHVGTGIFEFAHVLDQEGDWIWRWLGTGLVAASTERVVRVRHSFVAP